MFRKGKKNKAVDDSQLPPLVLTDTEENPLVTLPSDVVVDLRQMVTRIGREENLPKRLAVISALRGEGVSFIARGLAITMAHDLAADICLVELNWWASDHSFLKDNPNIEDANNGGLAAVLADEAELNDVLLQTGYENLWILPSGEMAKQDRPVMARSHKLKDVINELSSRFDHLILDIPAVRFTSDAVPLASLGTACCVVIRQGATPVNDVRQALDEIDHLPMVGVVLNNAKVATPSFITKLIPQK